MKIRSLLLGSVAAAGIASSGYAADLGVVTSLDVCDELGLSGLTISSDDNCLVITGGVTFEYNIGDYDPSVTVLTFDDGSDSFTAIDADARAQQTVSDNAGRYHFELAPGTYSISAYYSLGGRGQIEVRRSGIDVHAAEAVVVPLWVELAR